MASLADQGAEEILVRVDFFADLDDGRRIVSDNGHGICTAGMQRRGLGAIYRRYHGPGSPTADELEAGYRVGVSDIEDMVRETSGLLTLAQRRKNWASTVGFLKSELTGAGSERRRRRWGALRRALAEQAINTSQHDLDRLPFGVEIADSLRSELATGDTGDG
jgi:hypothetical protein